MIDPAVDVFICTYKRQSVIAAVDSVLGQSIKNTRISIHVVDNDEDRSAEIFFTHHSRVNYHHAPKQNISVARNKALSIADKEFLAFMDDDQVAAPNWLENLIHTIQYEKSDIVLGPVIANYPKSIENWVSKGDFYSTRPHFKNGKILETGYSGNVLLRRSCVGTVRFDEELGQSGGEDTIFFNELYRRGSKIAYCPEAIMTEYISYDRLRLGWLIRRTIRNGQTYARILGHCNKAKIKAIPTSVAKIIYSLSCSALFLASPVQWRKNLLRGMFHLGVLVSLFGKSEIQNYRGSDGH